MAKDFTVNTGRVYGNIAEATAEQEIQEKRKERRTYSEEEKQAFLASLKTSGRKGCKLPRINMAFTPELHDYIRTMSRAAGITLTEFLNIVIKQHMDEHIDDYKKAQEFKVRL